MTPVPFTPEQIEALRTRLQTASDLPQIAVTMKEQINAVLDQAAAQARELAALREEIFGRAKTLEEVVAELRAKGIQP